MRRNPADAWLKVSAVAPRLGVSASMVRDLIKRGDLRAVRHGKRGMYLVPESACDSYIEALEGNLDATAGAA